MKHVTSSAALSVGLFLAAHLVRADDRDLLVGTWEANRTMNGYTERGVIRLRENGTGRHERSASGHAEMYGNFTWNLDVGVIRFYYTRNDIKRARFRFENTNTIIVKPVDGSLHPVSPDIEYRRQFRQGPAPEAKERKQVVGVWEAAGTNDLGQSCRIELVLRDYGTGQHTLGCDGKRLEVPIGWEFVNGVVTKHHPDGSSAQGRVRFLDETNIGITPIDFSGRQIGAEVFYQKTAENDEGC